MASPGRPALSLSLVPGAGQDAYLRRELRTWCQQMGESDESREDVLLAASELFTNAAQASTPGARIGVRVEAGTGDVTITVCNEGRPFAFERRSWPQGPTRGGRGMLILQALGTVTVEHENSETTVTVVLPRRVGGGSDDVGTPTDAMYDSR